MRSSEFGKTIFDDKEFGDGIAIDLMPPLAPMIAPPPSAIKPEEITVDAGPVVTELRKKVLADYEKIYNNWDVPFGQIYSTPYFSVFLQGMSEYFGGYDARNTVYVEPRPLAEIQSLYSNPASETMSKSALVIELKRSYERLPLLEPQTIMINQFNPSTGAVDLVPFVMPGTGQYLVKPAMKAHIDSLANLYSKVNFSIKDATPVTTLAVSTTTAADEPKPLVQPSIPYEEIIKPVVEEIKPVIEEKKPAIKYWDLNHPISKILRKEVK